MHQPVTQKTYAAMLFDMDGTLLSSIAAAERVWGSWAERHGLDAATFLPTIHGVRAEDTIRRQNIDGIDLDAEVQWVTDAEMHDVGGIMPIEGIAAFLDGLPADRWAIVTSASLDLATRRLKAAGLTLPNIVVTAEDVEKGKPNPDCFLLAAKKLGVRISDCLVFEDAPAGIQAAEAAGADVMVIKATHQHPMETKHSSIHDYVSVEIGLDGAGRIKVVEKAL
jgi:sugar-phosphatase